MDKDTNEVLITNEEQNKKQEVKKEEPKKKVVKQKKVVAPKIFFKEDSRILVSIDAFHNKETGEYQFAYSSDRSEQFDKEGNFEKVFTKVVYKFWFTRIPYDKLNRYRSRSMIYNKEDQVNTINTLKLREHFLVYHLVDWNLTDENGEKIELKFDPDNALSDESLDLIYTLPSNLIDLVLSIYQNKMQIS